MIPTLVAGALLLLLLAAPLHVELRLAREEALQVEWRVTWLFGLVRWRPGPRAEERDASAAPGSGEPEPEARDARRGSRFVRRRIPYVLRSDFRACLGTFLGRALRALRPRDLHLRARVGLDDPADTGRLWGALGPLNAFCGGRDFWLEPDFEGACLHLDAAGRARIVPLQLLAVGSAFLLSPPVLRALFAR